MIRRFLQELLKRYPREERLATATFGPRTDFGIRTCEELFDGILPDIDAVSRMALICVIHNLQQGMVQSGDLMIAWTREDNNIRLNVVPYERDKDTVKFKTK
jgi:hypothetical protein